MIKQLDLIEKRWNELIKEKETGIALKNGPATSTNKKRRAEEAKTMGPAVSRQRIH